MNNLHGLEVHIDDTMVDIRWEFPVRRFVEWEAKDEGWARKLGWGREVREPSKTVMRVGNRLYMHSVLYEQLKKTFAKEPEVRKKNNSFWLQY